MSIFDRFLKFTPPNTGYVVDSEFWLRDLPKHEIFAGGGEAVDWSRYAPAFRYQESTMMCTAFAGANIASMLEKRETGRDIEFSPLELFTRSNGTVYGNSIQATADAMRVAVMPEKSCPWITGISEWTGLVLRLLRAYSQVKTPKLDAGKPFAIKQVTYVNPDRVSMRAALAESPLLAIVNVGRGYFDNPAPAVTSGAAHAVVITNVAADGKIRVFDSLTQTSGFSGFHWLSADFPILYAFGVLDLPDNWQDMQQNILENENTFALAHYGKPRNIAAEGTAQTALQEAKRKNPTNAAFIDASWNLFVLAVAYGGYSVQDVLNETTNLRRGKGSLFNFNELRTR